MNNTIKAFTDLYSWQESHKLVLMIYKLLRKYPSEEKIQFYYQAQGSLTEIKNQLITSKDLDYINQTDFSEISSQADVAHQLLQGLITKSKSFIHKS